MPPDILTIKDSTRGYFDYRVNDQGSSVFVWMDSKPVYLASNCHGNEETKVKRVVKKDGTRAEVPCPTVVFDYNKGMGGVDLADRYRALYCVDRKSRKWWHRLFFWMLDIAFVNAFVIYCQLFEKVSVLEFRRSLSLGLLTYSPNNRGGSKRNSAGSPRQQTAAAPKKRKTLEYSVSKEVRLGNRGIHWPKFYDTRGRCEVCSKEKIESRPYSKCDHCNVFLCCNDKKNCFFRYHHDQ
ncbi:piggyBac transposable element-derived protein 3-like [Homalodisca vitripennis]|uniref:piggyBac transposable element-derived protein 3-like n=1 Tax=Homalodisca vitripennis TaxID=197043 RepID=UPI001EEBB045|nr:piggyBac transposable element-derived protein 3-like [Homalodisca vitripennis]